MQFPETWLREFCNPPISTEALAEVLTMAGLEVEATRPAAPPFSGVVVGSVLSVERHPNADRLRVARVDVGTGRALSIVCGAPNVRAGIKVPCATVGALLPPAGGDGADAKPFEIKLGMLRGVESEGMLCSARELKLSDDAAGLLLLDDAAPVGQNLREHLSLDDTIFTLKLTPNLGHALGIHGIAREVSALTGAALVTPAIEPVRPEHDSTLHVTVEAPDLCGRFSGRVIRNVDPRAPTPRWMVDRLARCGQRSVTALVDISNYVMFEYGRPTHIFDLDRIDGGLTVRWGRAGETLVLLNGETIQIDAGVGVIADQRAVESLAGIMGGKATAVGDDTTNVYVEAAFWWPAAVAGRSRRYGFSTDAGHRFERGVDPATTALHVERITALIIDICGGRAGPLDDQTLALPPCAPVTLRVARAARVIGMPVTVDDCAGVMQRLRLPFSVADGVVTVTPPSWRFDLQIEEDLIEEVIRVIGYDKLPDAPPVAAVTARVQSESRRSADALRHALAALGYFETIGFSFVEQRADAELTGNVDPIRVLNPISSTMSVMRSGLAASLLGVLRHNLARKVERLRVFEIGRVFRRDATVPDGDWSVAGVSQPLRVAGLLFGPAAPVQWGVQHRGVDYFDAKADVEALFAPAEPVFVAAEHPALHPGRSAQIVIGGRAVGYLGELHPRWRQADELPSSPMLFEIDLETLLARELPRFAEIAKRQSAWRDIAVIVGDRLTHAELMNAVDETPTPLLRSARLFDIYQPTTPLAGLKRGERSFAVRLELLDDVAPMTDELIDAAVAQVVEHLRSRFGARLRGQSE